MGWLMRARPLVLYLTLVVIGVAAGFFMGARVMAGGTGPGSAADPLVSRSYVDEQVATYIAGLNQKISDLTTREAQLEQALAQAQKQQGITPIQPATATRPRRHRPPTRVNRLRPYLPAALHQGRQQLRESEAGPGHQFPAGRHRHQGQSGQRADDGAFPERRLVPGAPPGWSHRMGGGLAGGGKLMTRLQSRACR